MQVQRTLLHYVRVLSDHIFIWICLFSTLYYTSSDFDFFARDNFVIALLLSFTWFFSSKSTGMYDEFRGRNFSFEIAKLINNVFVQSIAAIIILFIIREKNVSRLFAVVFFISLVVVLSVQKIIYRGIFKYLRLLGRNFRSILIIGAGEVGRQFYSSILGNPHFGYYLVGFLDDYPVEAVNGKYLGKISTLDDVLNKNVVDEVIVALPNYATKEIENVITVCENHTTRVKIIPDYFKFTGSKYDVSMFGKFPIFSVRTDKLNDLQWRIIKRTFDTVFSLFLFVFVFSWMWPLIALCIKLSSPGPVFFAQERWGRKNRKFKAYKFRSMQDECNHFDENGNFMQVSKNDIRVTKVGKFLRKTNLDELPQFINVLLGEMSIVGPRPHPTPLNIESRDKVKLYMLRHLVKPGITGWAQVNGLRGETTQVELMQQRIEFDLWYIENWSFILDLQIIILTVWRMIKGDENAY